MDNTSRGSGRRSIVHEFPHRDLPYTEDMGRKVRVFPVTGYVVGPFYKDDRDNLIYALEAEGPGQLVLPTLGEWTVRVRDYSVREEKRAGGLAAFDMSFVEVGDAIVDAASDTQSNVRTSAGDAKSTIVSSSENSDVWTKGTTPIAFT